MTVTLVAAVAANGVIGVTGSLPWDLPEDLKHFKALTLGHPMVMGRTTYEAIGRPLPGRTTIVVTRQKDWSAMPSDNVVVETAGSVVAAVARAAELDDDVFVVGGGQVYSEALARDLVDLMVITRVHAAPEGDTRFPAIDWSAWEPAASIEHPAHGDRPGFEIVTYTRS